jgi:peptidoglycan/xylan/chitin deacetylase (PgdA/CDA1 family)
MRRLQYEGVEFGSHSATHRPLTGFSVADIVREAARSRAALACHLRCPVRALAYPYGHADRVVEHLSGACGYVFGLTCVPEPSGFNHRLLALPRLEVGGSDDTTAFIKKLSVPWPHAA